MLVQEDVLPSRSASRVFRIGSAGGQRGGDPSSRWDSGRGRAADLGLKPQALRLSPFGARMQAPRRQNPRPPYQAPISGGTYSRGTANYSPAAPSVIAGAGTASLAAQSSRLAASAPQVSEAAAAVEPQMRHMPLL